MRLPNLTTRREGDETRPFIKTYRQLYPQVCDFENLYLAYRAARKGKRSSATVAAFEFNQESELAQLQVELANRRYWPKLM